jgi:hypothetical protein
VFAVPRRDGVPVLSHLQVPAQDAIMNKELEQFRQEIEQ